MLSFDKLTDPSKINVKAKRISIKTVNKTSTLRSILQGYKINTSDGQNEHAILNGMELTDQLTAGTLIKVIE